VDGEKATTPHLGIKMSIINGEICGDVAKTLKVRITKIIKIAK
jgi:hypothetical protein